MLVGDLLTSSAERFPEKTAIICGEQRLSYGELDELSNRFAWALIRSGVRYSDRVGVLLDNSVEAAIAIFGILKAGGIFVVISQTIKPDKLKFILDDCSARALVSHTLFDGVVGAMESGTESPRSTILFGSRVPEGSIPGSTVFFDEDPMSFPCSSPARQAIDVDVAALIYTSGTTGFPKGVTVSHLNVISAANSITEYLENVAADVILNVLPLSFDYGLYQLLMSVKTGAALVLERSFAYPFRVVETIRKERVTGFPGVPTMFSVLLQMKDLDADAFDSVRYVSNTAAALPPSHIRGIQRLFRKARIYSMYGLTECKRVSYLPPEQLDTHPTSVGKGMPNEQAFVVNELGEITPPGEVGELVVRGSNVMLGYWNRPEETERVIRPGRYPWERLFYTGDLFTMDEDGYLYFVSRKDDIIKSRGEKVSPAEIERIIHELEDVREAAVVGVPDPILGQAVRAIVVKAGSSSLTEREVMFHCARRLESFMVPKDVEFRASLPKTPSGKISRKDLQHVSSEASKEDR